MPVKITISKNGPYQVSGDLEELELHDSEGNPYDLGSKKRIFLCRCGASTTKPFCDGQHSKIGFAAAEAAVERD
ncbi:MAG TPA: CDGSH iron-sulfur domain-containing protein [Sphingomonadaceae bacterium]